MRKRSLYQKSGEREFVPYIGRSKRSGKATRLHSFIGELRRASGGYKLRTSRQRGGGSRFGWGGVGSKGRSYYQQVSIKTRFVLNSKSGGGKGLLRHTKYLQREGVSKEGGLGELVSNDGRVGEEGIQDVIKTWGSDRHYWRVIISPEFGRELDLGSFAAEYVSRLEEALGTKLTWLSASHYNTDRPHTHLLIRGKRSDGTDLVISRDYVSYGMRHLAEQIVTERLGVRSEKDIVKQLKLEVDQDRLVAIDRVLFREGRKHAGTVDVRPKRVLESNRTKTQRSLKIARLKHLRALGLAREAVAGVWTLAEGGESVLREMGMRGDIIKTMHRCMGYGDVSKYVIYTTSNVGDIPITGRVKLRGLSDELSDSKFIVIEGLDGRSYYVKLGRYSEAKGSEALDGRIVSVVPYKPRVSLTRADKNIFEVSKLNGGIYNYKFHLRYVRANVKLSKDVTPDEYIANHQRRLEALERRRIVSPLGKGEWRIPNNYFEIISKNTNVGRLGEEAAIEIESFRALEAQIDARGITWLDRLMVNRTSIDDGANLTDFQLEVKESLKKRAFFLERLGFPLRKDDAIPSDGGSVIDKLYELELSEATKRLEPHYGYFAKIFELKSLTGTIKAVENLPSGPHLLVVGEGKFSLVPMRRGMEKLRPKDKVRFDVIGIGLDRQRDIPLLKQVRINYSVLLRKPDRGSFGSKR